MTRRLLIVVLIILATGGHLSAQKSKPPRRKDGIRWCESFEEAALASVKRDAPIIIYAYRENNSTCKKFESTVLDSKKFRRLSRMFVMVRAETTRDANRLRPYQVMKFPALLYLDSSGKQLYRLDKDRTTKRATALMGQTYLMSMFNSGKLAKDTGNIRRARLKFIPLVFIGRGTPVGKMADKELRAIEADSIKQLSRAQIAFDEKEYVKTMTLLDDLIYHYRGTSGAKQGVVLIKRLLREMEMLGALRESRRRADAQRMLAYAKKVEKRTEQMDTVTNQTQIRKEALMVYWDVIRDYPDTPAEEEAAKNAERLSDDEALVENAKAARVERDYKRWSEIAQSYWKNGRYKEAVESYDRIIKNYPDTPEADKAQQAIRLLQTEPTTPPQN